jgi:hypothetical protein
MELILLPLTTFMSLEASSDVFMLLIFAALILGTVFLHHTSFGGWSWWPLISGAFVINWTFLYGFLGYGLGVGLFLWGIAGWVRWSRAANPWRHLYGAMMASLLFFVHLAAFGLYAVAVAGFEIQRFLESAKGRDRQGTLSAGLRLLLASVQFVPPMMLLLWSPARDVGVMEQGLAGVTYAWTLKATAPIATLTSGNPWLDLSGGLLAVVLAALILVFGHLGFARHMIGATVALVVAYLVLPRILSPASLVDSRIPTAILFIVVASLQVSLEGRVARMVAVLVAGFMLAKGVVLADDWRRHDVLLEEYFQAFDLMQDESTLFFVTTRAPTSFLEANYTRRMESPSHVADLATLTGRIFVPSVFAQAGQHAIAVREKFAELKRYQQSDAIVVRDAAGLARVIAELDRLHQAVSPGRAAYLVLLDRGDELMPLPEGAGVIASGPGFRLAEIYLPR